MKRLSITLLLTIYASLAVLAAEEHLRIMTFNVPKTNIPSEGVNLWEYRVAAMQEYWQRLSLDILCMQEPQKQDLIDFLSGMPDYSIVGRGRNSGVESGEYEPIIYNTKTIRIEKYGFFWLSTTPDVPSKSWNTICIRMATWAVIRDIRTGGRFILINTHLDHGEDQCKENQMKVVKTRLAAIQNNYPRLPAIVTGDMNSLPNSTCYNIATRTTEPHMQDSWDVAATRIGTGKTTSNKRIDYIYITDDITCEKCEIDESLQPSGLKYSDHNPCWADLTWELDDETDVRSAVAEADRFLDSLVVNTSGTTPLITDADKQCSADAVETKEGQYFRYITDGSTDTYLHSLYSSMPPNGSHWMQVDLMSNPVSDFHFVYTRRAGGYGPRDRWTDILVTASNDKSTWTDVAHIHDFGGEELVGYPSETIHMHKQYRFIRFIILHTGGMKLINAGPMFTVSEFQMYEDKCEFSKKYDDDAYATKALNDLKAKKQELEEEISKGNYDTEMADELRQLIAKARIGIDKDLLRQKQEALSSQSLLAVSKTHTGTLTPTESILNTEGDHCPLSCNALSELYGNDMTTLLDGNRKTGIQSDETGSIEATEHWIQAELTEPTDRFSFSTMRLYNSKLTNCLPIEFYIYASDDTEHWDRIIPYTSTAKATSYNLWTSPTIMLPKQYSNLRFVVTRNYSSAVNPAGAMIFNLAEFNVLRADETGSEYQNDDDIKSAADNLQLLQGQAAEVLQSRLLTYEEEAALRQALDDLNEAREKYITAIPEVAHTTTSTTPSFFTLSGINVKSPTQSGIYIHNGRKVVVK